MKKGVGSGFGSISQRYRSGDPDPEPHQNGMDPQHWKKVKVSIKFFMENLGWQMRILIRFLYIFSKKYLIKIDYLMMGCILLVFFRCDLNYNVCLTGSESAY
jgi:hypothetical protein